MLEKEFRQEVERRKRFNKEYLLNNLIEASGTSSDDKFRINNLKNMIEQAVKDGLLTDLYTVKQR